MIRDQRQARPGRSSFACGEGAAHHAKPRLAPSEIMTSRLVHVRSCATRAAWQVEEAPEAPRLVSRSGRARSDVRTEVFARGHRGFGWSVAL
jgi:hypothetical protein